MKFGEKIIKLRKEKGLSQEEFGNKINVSRQAVSKWENGEVKPDTDKIQEIVKKFNVSYEYLLNDEIENDGEHSKEFVKKDKKHKIKGILKVILIIFIIYLLICIYKFIAFYRFYSIANSFSEKNYMMDQNIYITSLRENANNKVGIIRVGNKILEETYHFNESNTESIKTQIVYTDIDKREAYELYYSEDKGKYIYHDRKKDMINENEINKLFEDKNAVKENTLSSIPSSFKQILLASINPMYYYVDIVNREIRTYSLATKTNITVKLSSDYLLERTNWKSDNGNSMDVLYSYDYVQDHFREIDNPLELYKDNIIFEE